MSFETEKKSIVKPFAIWEVDGKEYKLKLTTSGILRCEEKLGMNLMTLVMRTGNDDLPPLKAMFVIVHQALQPYEHGIKESDVLRLYDKYCEDGGSQMAFMTDVFIPIYQVSGFFSKAQATEMEESLSGAKELM